MSCAKSNGFQRQPNMDARVVELVDSLASGASARKGVRVRLPPRAPEEKTSAFGRCFFLLSQIKVLTTGKSCGIIYLTLNAMLQRQPNMDARVVELVDSLASGASARKGVRVRLPPRAPKRRTSAVQVFFFYLDLSLTKIIFMISYNPVLKIRLYGV